MAMFQGNIAENWILLDITRYYQILPDITGYYQLLPDITGYYRILPDITRYYQILPDITRYFQILPDITRSAILLKIMSVYQWFTRLFGSRHFERLHFKKCLTYFRIPTSLFGMATACRNGDFRNGDMLQCIVAFTLCSEASPGSCSSPLFMPSGYVVAQLFLRHLVTL